MIYPSLHCECQLHYRASSRASYHLQGKYRLVTYLPTILTSEYLLKSTELMEIALIFIIVNIIISVIAVLSHQEQVNDVGLLLLGDWVVHGAGPSHDWPLHHRGAPLHRPHQPQGVHLQGQQGLRHHCSCHFFLLPCGDDGFLLCQVSLNLQRMLCFYEFNGKPFLPCNKPLEKVQD